MSHYATEAFVFRCENRLEADKVFSVFTREFGRMEIFAKAIRKIDAKLKSGIELFSFSDIEFVEGLKRRTLTDSVFTHRGSQNPERFTIYLSMGVVLDRFLRGEEKDERIWNVLVDVFEKLHQESNVIRLRLWYYYFFWNLVTILGHGPELVQCVVCAKALDSAHIFFSYHEGGVVCKDCSQKISGVEKVDVGVIKMLRMFVRQEKEWLSKIKMTHILEMSLRETSRRYYRYLAETYAMKL